MTEQWMIDDQLSTLTDVCEVVTYPSANDGFGELIVDRSAAPSVVWSGKCRKDSGIRVEKRDAERTIVMTTIGFWLPPDATIESTNYIRHSGKVYQVARLRPPGTYNVLLAVGVEEVE